jgi:hypothetical protein
VSTETASLVQQISNLRDVITRQNAQIAALQALSGSSHGHMPEAARAEADATILAWGPNFRATLAWELEHEADAQIAYEAWEQLVLKMATARHAPAPSSEDTPADAPAPRDSAWEIFEWPSWVPAAIRSEIERFWGARSHRDPSAWQRNIAHNHAPHLGQVVTLPVLALGKPVLKTGRYVHCWNNIGRLVHDDGTWTYTSFSPDWAASQPPLSEVTAGGKA